MRLSPQKTQRWALNQKDGPCFPTGIGCNLELVNFLFAVLAGGAWNRSCHLPKETRLEVKLDMPAWEKCI